MLFYTFGISLPPWQKHQQSGAKDMHDNKPGEYAGVAVGKLSVKVTKEVRAI